MNYIVQFIDAKDPAKIAEDEIRFLFETCPRNKLEYYNQASYKFPTKFAIITGSNDPSFCFTYGYKTRFIAPGEIDQYVGTINSWSLFFDNDLNIIRRINTQRIDEKYVAEKVFECRFKNDKYITHVELDLESVAEKIRESEQLIRVQCVREDVHGEDFSSLNFGISM